MRLHRNEYGFNYLLDNEAIVGIIALRFLFLLHYVASWLPFTRHTPQSC